MNESIEGWTGPEKPVDVILASHVFYHIQDKVTAVRKLCTWIKPGGSIIIILGHEHAAYTKLGNTYSLSQNLPTPSKQYPVLSVFRTQAG